MSLVLNVQILTLKYILNEAAQTDAEETNNMKKNVVMNTGSIAFNTKLKAQIKDVLEQMKDGKRRTNLTGKEAKFTKGNGKIDVN